jgi:predicted RNA-binding protein with PUA-like domain
MAQLFWLMKSEPDVFSIHDLKKKGTVSWDGVRNYTARNFMRDKMKKGDGVLFYHSSCDVPAVAGLARVVKESHPDLTQFDPKSPYFDPQASQAAPRWFLVDLAFAKAAKEPIPGSFLKGVAGLKGMALFKFGRLSVQPVSPKEWSLIVKLKGYW